MTKKLLGQISVFLCGLSLLALFAKESIGTLCFVAFTLFTLFFLIQNRKENHFDMLFVLISSLSLAYFVLGIIGVVINKASSVAYLIRLVPFCVAPILLLYFRLQRKYLVTFCKLFLAGNLILLLVLDIYAIVDMIAEGSLYVVQGNYQYYRFMYTRYTTGEYFTHIYLSAYSFLSLILILQYTPFRRNLNGVLIVYLLVHLFMMGSRAVVIAMLFAAILYLTIAAIRNRKYIKYLLSFFAVVMLLFSIAFVFKDTVFFNRYSQVFEWYENKDLLLKRNTSINKRFKIYVIGASFFSEKSFSIDGTGIVEDKISEKYATSFSDAFDFKTETYNAHNQYINNFIDWGYAGILLLLLLLIIIVKIALDKKLYWLVYFWLFFAFLLTMESVLIRQRGILLFVIFYTLVASAAYRPVEPKTPLDA